MIHLQTPVNDWLQAVDRLPAGSLVKAVDNVQALSEAKAHNAGINTCLRHHYDEGQVFGGTFEENKARARAFFATFIDDTFKQHAHNVTLVEEFNEYIAQSHNQVEKTERITWARAAAEVWKVDYRTKPEYAHIRLVLCNTAIGNDIPWEYAQIAVQYDCVLGYHPYTLWETHGVAALQSTTRVDTSLDPAGREFSMNAAVEMARQHRRVMQMTFDVSSGVPIRDPGDWQWLSGRWATMDADYRNRGYTVRWAFTESGPFSSAVSGWRHESCLGESVPHYLESIRSWIRDTKTTNAYQTGRIYGFVLFTTGGGVQWEWFETNQPELNSLADMVKQEWTTVVVPPDPPATRTWNKLVYLLPQQTTMQQYDDVQAVAFPTRSEIAFSADSAFARPDNVVSHKVIVYAPELWGGQAALNAFVAQHYQYTPATTIEYRAFPTLVVDGYDSPVGTDEERHSDSVWN